MVIEYPSGRIVGPAFVGAGGINDVAFTPDGRRLVGGGADGAVHRWDLERGRRVASTASGQSRPITNVELSHDVRLLATLGREQLIRLWTMDRDYPLAQERPVFGQAAKGLAISADGSRMAAGDDAGMVQVWQLPGGSEPLRLTGHERQVWAIAFSPDGSLLASGDRSGDRKSTRLNSSH